MKLVVLVDNTAPRGLECEHGFSLYAEVGGSKILIDTGASDMFARNAQKLGVDLAGVHAAVLTHGHDDHAGGLMKFASMNRNARIYAREGFDCDYFNVHGKYIGVDKRIANLRQLVITRSETVVEEQVRVFGDFAGVPSGDNLGLKKMYNGELVQDDFSHEQGVALWEGDKRVLVTGCAHNGVENMILRSKELYGALPQVVVSGFHLRHVDESRKEEIEALGRRLAEMGVVFYTGHCTSREAFAYLKPILGDNLQNFTVGTVIEI